MKSILIALMTLVSLASFADDGHEGGEFGVIYCVQHRPLQDGKSHLVVMTQLKHTPNAQINRLYNLQLFQKDMTTRQRTLIFEDNVTVRTEDVVAQFKGFRGSKGQRTKVNIYMDGLNESGIEFFDGRALKRLNLTCRPNSQGLQLWNSSN
jgi:hypothetical protein